MLNAKGVTDGDKYREILEGNLLGAAKGGRSLPDEMRSVLGNGIFIR